jgi:hypothetical protein
MIAVRRLRTDGSAGDVEVLPAAIASSLFENREAVPANGGRTDTAIPEGLPHIDPGVEVHGLTDRDPEFFEKQQQADKDKMLHDAAGDRMQRGAPRQKGR